MALSVISKEHLHIGSNDAVMACIKTNILLDVPDMVFADIMALKLAKKKTVPV